MKKLNREEVFMYVEKIRKGLGSDEEVTRWLQEISDSVPNRNILGAIMSGNNATTEEVVNKLYEASVIYLWSERRVRGIKSRLIIDIEDYDK